MIILFIKMSNSKKTSLYNQTSIQNYLSSSWFGYCGISYFFQLKLNEKNMNYQEVFF